jgi:hypothetical protein
VSGLAERRPQPASTVRRLTAVHPDLQRLPGISRGHPFARPVSHYSSNRCRSAPSSLG